jgi:eukaryotic-like serine/threonine-protein kinase
MIGKTISHYRVVEKLGEGGMGVVYVAEDTLLGRRVAIKMLTIKPGQDEHHFRTRFLREARAVSALSHPHIATIHDYGETKRGQPYIVMELVKGETLGDLMANGSLTIPRALQIIQQVAEALAEAHRNGVVHRDIKPSNVAVDHRGEVKVLDFGLAKQLNVEPKDATDPERQTLLTSQTQEGVIVGTPLYLSPEQALGAEIDARSDIFAVGSLLYECVAGRPAFDGETRMEICTKVIRDDPVRPSKLNPDVPEAVDRITMKALAKQPAERYQTASELVADLDTALSASGIASRAVPRITLHGDGNRPTGALATLSDIFRRPRISVGYVVAGIAFVLVAGLLIWYATRPKPYDPKPEAKRLYDQAVDALRQGAFFKSSKILQQAVLYDDRFALAHARLAEADMELDNSDDAKDQLIRANDLAKNIALPEVDTIRLQAITDTVKRDFAAAVSDYQQIVGRVSRNEQAYALVDLGRAYEKNEQWGKAIETYQQASQLDSHYAAAFLRLGVALQHNQKFGEAAAALDQAHNIFRISNEVEGMTEAMFQRGILLVKQGKVADGEAEFQQALQRSQALENTEQRIRILQQLSYTYALAGNVAKSREHSQQAMQLAQANQMENLTTAGLIEIGNSYMVKGDFAEAEKNFSEALRLAQLYKARANEARALISLANSRQAQGDPDAARDYTQRALAFYQQGGYGTQLLYCYFFLGRAQEATGDYKAAERSLQDLLVSASKVGDKRFEALAHEGLGLTFLHSDRLVEALTHFTEEYRIAKAMDTKIILGFAANYAGAALSRLGNYDEGNKYLNEATAIASGQDEYKYLLAEVSWTVADIALSQREFGKAIEHAQKAIALAESDKATAARARATLGLAQTLNGNAAAGRKNCEDAVQMARAVRDPLPLSQALFALAQAALAAGDVQGAMNAALEAQQRFTTASQREYEWRAYALAARAAEKSGDNAKSQQLASQALNILNGLERAFGVEHFQTYLNRADIKELRSQLATN